MPKDNTETIYVTDEGRMNVCSASFPDLKSHYDNTLNMDKTTYVSSNDEPTPISCVEEMIEKLPEELWGRENLRILDPCCGNGNFAVPVFFELMRRGRDKRQVLENVLAFNDTNELRLDNVRNVFCGDRYALQVSQTNYLTNTDTQEHTYDLVMANPPYAKILENGKRASKNHNLIKDFIEKSLSLLKPGGYLLFITPDNWMSYADRNLLITTLTSLQIVHLDIHSAKKHFKKIGSSFTWYVIENSPSYKDMQVSGVWKKTPYTSSVVSQPRKYIPLVFNDLVQSILAKTVDNPALKKFKVETSSDLHKYTKAALICSEKNDTYCHKLIHTPKQTVYASRPHKFQDGFKVFISTTDKYQTFVDDCGMTQSIAFIRCTTKSHAEYIASVLRHPLYVFINNICRWGNFNNIRILQSLPVPDVTDSTVDEEVYNYFGITKQEVEYIEKNK